MIIMNSLKLYIIIMIDIMKADLPALEGRLGLSAQKTGRLQRDSSLVDRGVNDTMNTFLQSGRPTGQYAPYEYGTVELWAEEIGKFEEGQRGGESPGPRQPSPRCPARHILRPGTALSAASTERERSAAALQSCACVGGRLSHTPRPQES